MICSNCGNENVDGSVLCGFCGASLEPAYPVSAQPGAYDSSLDGAAQWNAESGGYGQPYAGAVAQPGQQQPQLSGQPAEGYGMQPGQPYADAAQPGGQPAQPYGTAQPPQAYAAAQPPQTYAAAQPTQPKKNKTMLIVGIIIAAVIVLGGGSIGGYFIYQSVTGDAQATRQPPVNGSEGASEPGSQSGTGAQSGTKTNFTAAFENPYVILDEDEIKITIDLGSGERDRANAYDYSVSCVVENKTSNFFGIRVNDPSGKGYIGGDYGVHISKEGHYGAGKSTEDFAPGESFAVIRFNRDDIEGGITDFTARIALNEVGDYSAFVVYGISIAKF